MKHTFKSDEIFRNFNEKLRCEHVFHKWYSTKELAAKIFDHCIHDILLDVIENNVTFVLPLSFGKYAEIYMQTYSDEDFKKVYRSGAFRSIDFLKSNFTGNRLMYLWKNKKGNVRKKPIHVFSLLNQKLKDYTEQGRQYN